PDRPADLDPNEMYPRGALFPLTAFSVAGTLDTDEERAAEFERAKRDGFTMIGPQYELNKRVVDDARRHGMKAAYHIGIDMKFLSDAPLELTPDEIRTQITAQVAEVADSPEIAWWYLTPEELRHWRGNEMAYLEAATDAIRSTDPLKRPIYMYDPGHRNAAGLAPIVKHLDICGKGMYTNYSGFRDARVWVRWTMEQEVAAVAEANPSAIPIAVPEMFQQPDAEHIALVPAWVRHDMYLSLVSGAKGVVIFSLRHRDRFDAHGVYYDAYARVGRELNGELGLGQVFLFGERREDVSIKVIEGPATLALSWNVGKEKMRTAEYPSVVHLDVACGDRRCLFAVNSARAPVRCWVSGLPVEPVMAHDVFGEEEPIAVEGGGFELGLDPLGVRAFRFAAPE
ncbi:MAG: hypothetical protein GY851_31195, partial [bacterium]|nr:hypothetical protein [bacterium]